MKSLSNVTFLLYFVNVLFYWGTRISDGSVNGSCLALADVHGEGSECVSLLADSLGLVLASVSWVAGDNLKAILAVSLHCEVVAGRLLVDGLAVLQPLELYGWLEREQTC